MGITGRFAGIEEAKVFKTGQYFKPGLYTVKIKAVKWVVGSVGKKEFVVIETEVLESNNPEVPVGGERSQVIDYSSVMGQPNVKAFVAAASGVDPGSSNVNDEVSAYWSKTVGEHLSFEAICDLIVSDTNPLEDVVLGLECVEVTTKSGDPFTKHSWQPNEQA
jgi:hypothetical protein